MADDFSDNRFQRRMPSVERKISSIKAEDIRIRILGTILDKKDTHMVVDDGTGKIEVFFEEPVGGEINQMVRVFGRVIPVENGFEMQGEIVQDMSQLDIELHRKVEGALGGA